MKQLSEETATTLLMEYHSFVFLQARRIVPFPDVELLFIKVALAPVKETSFPPASIAEPLAA